MQRAVLLADGRVIADGPAAELLAGGWYFATETARILGGAHGALLPEQGAELLRKRREHSKGDARAAADPTASGVPREAAADTTASGVPREAAADTTALGVPREAAADTPALGVRR
jgi:hypothetical protein